MPLLHVYDDEIAAYTVCEFDERPSRYSSSLREVSPEELAEVRHLLAEYEKLQALLKQIHARPGVEYKTPR